MEIDPWRDWQTWDTPGRRLKGARNARGLNQQGLAEKAEVKQGDISKLETGRNSTTAKWPSLARALEVDAYWLSDGEGTPIAFDGGVPLYQVPSVAQAVEVIALALQGMDSIGRELAGSVLASIAKLPEQPESAAAMLSTLIEHHTKLPPPSPAPSGKGKKTKQTAKERQGGKVVLTVKQGGGNKRQLSLIPQRAGALRKTVADPFNPKLAPKKEAEWYDTLPKLA